MFFMLADWATGMLHKPRAGSGLQCLPRPRRLLRNARVIDLMTLNSDSDSKAKSDDSDSSHDSKSLDSG